MNSKSFYKYSLCAKNWEGPQTRYVSYIHQAYYLEENINEYWNDRKGKTVLKSMI